MAKKKKSKTSESKTFQYSVELTGLVLVLIGLIGFGFGPVGGIIKKFTMFLVGEWWPVLLIIVLWLGVYMITKRKLPKFFSSRLIGFYVVLIVILIMSHFSFIELCKNSKDIFQSTLNNYMDRIATMGSSGGIITAGQSNIVIGGGIIGAVFSAALSFLFDKTGTIIVLSILGVFGIIMLFNITLNDVVEKLKIIFLKLKPSKKLKADSDTEEEDNRVIITSVEELTHRAAPEQMEMQYESNLVVEEARPNKGVYRLPSLSLLDPARKTGKVNSTEFIRSNQTNLERVLNDFQIHGTVTEIHVGPAVTQYELSIPAGTKVNRISSIHKEIALALAAKDVRIQAPIPGKSTIGIEIPNPYISEVKLRDILDEIEANPRKFEKFDVLVGLGKDIMGRNQYADLASMPHLLVAGSTGSGKSVCINSIIISILMRYTPDEVKLVLVDPKKVELSNYNGVPHLLSPVVTDPKKASVALQSIVRKMEERYELFSEYEAKSITSYNNMIEREMKKYPEKNLKKLPFIVVIIDELADLMLIASKEVEDSIMRITQMARAAGIHLIVATQRPSTDIITGVVKTNIPSRMSFKVSNGIDSRTILDMQGAEKLLGKGDMLYRPMGENVPIRIQGAYISDDEIRKVINYTCNEQKSSYDNSLIEPDVQTIGSGPGGMDNDDPIYNEVVEFAIAQGKVSASLLQRRFRLGYNRAARIVDLLEERGIIGPQNGSKPRDVLVKLENREED